jgi:hypothetical protein
MKYLCGVVCKKGWEEGVCVLVICNFFGMKKSFLLTIKVHITRRACFLLKNLLLRLSNILVTLIHHPHTQPSTSAVENIVASSAAVEFHVNNPFSLRICTENVIRRNCLCVFLHFLALYILQCSNSRTCTTRANKSLRREGNSSP